MTPLNYKSRDDRDCCNYHQSCFNCKSRLGKAPFHRCGDRRSKNFQQSVTLKFSCGFYK